MKVCDLFEKEEKEESLLPVDSIAMMLFKKKAGIVKDPKRDKDKTYIGVTNAVSTIKDSTGKALKLSFDNSTDSEEFEIDSFTSLKLEKGGDLDKAIRKLFTKHEVDSKKKIHYMVRDNESYIRGIHLGKQLGKSEVKLVADLIKLLKPQDKDVEEVEVDSKESKKEKKA